MSNSETVKEYLFSLGLSADEPTTEVEPDYNLKLVQDQRWYGNKNKYLVTNSKKVALVRLGYMLEMYLFNRYVKRQFALDSKKPVTVKVVKNKGDQWSIKCNERVIPFNALRGKVEFKVISFDTELKQDVGEIEII